MRVSILHSNCPFWTSLLNATIGTLVSIGPETNDPTVIFRTGCTLPVALTTETMSPESTSANRQLGRLRRFQYSRSGPQPATPPASRPSTISHFSARRMTGPILSHPDCRRFCHPPVLYLIGSARGDATTGTGACR